MSAPRLTTAEALRSALVSAIVCGAHELREAVGEIVVATSADCPDAGADVCSVYVAQSRTMVLLTDRIYEGQEAAVLAREIERHHGRHVAEAVLGEAAFEKIADPCWVRPGISVRTLKGEIDTDEYGQERTTPPGTLGCIAGHNHGDHWDVTFPNGAWVVLTESELFDREQYHLGEVTVDNQQGLGDLYAKWDNFADVPVSEDGAIEKPFLHFGVGANRETIWRWFESQNPRFIVGDVMNGIRHKDDRNLTNCREHEGRKVALSRTTLTFSLPDDFGRGWDYSRYVLHGATHAWAGSYDRLESDNFAHEALHQVVGIDQSSLYVGMSCTATFQVESIDEAKEIQKRLQAVVDAFPPRQERQINVRGSNFYDSQVTENDANDLEIEVVSDMPYLNYLAKYVPLAEAMSALSGHDLATLRAQADEHQLAKKAGVQHEDCQSPGM